MNARPPTADPADVRDILELETPATRVIVAAVVIAMAYGASQSTEGISPAWPVAVVVLIMAAATVALVAVPHDPLPLGAAVLMALAPPAAAAILLSVVPVPMAMSNQVWISGYATLIYVFMCLRGRILLAWLSVAASVGVHSVWSASTGQGVWEGAQIPIYNAGALLAATLIAIAIRRTTRSILALRSAAVLQAADASAVSASQQVRRARLAGLDQEARPLLARIATGVPLSDDERQDCELLEAHLRDQIRAAALVTPTTAIAARQARTRGVEVMLIDDGGLGAVSDEVRGAIHTAVAQALDDADNGDVRIRVLPPGRPNLVTIYRGGESGTERIDVDSLGRISIGDAAHQSSDENSRK